MILLDFPQQIYNTSRQTGISYEFLWIMMSQQRAATPQPLYNALNGPYLGPYLQMLDQPLDVGVILDYWKHNINQHHARNAVGAMVSLCLAALELKTIKKEHIDGGQAT